MKLSVNGKSLKDDIAELYAHIQNDPSFIRLIVKRQKELIKEGIDLDWIDTDILIRLFIHRKNIQKELRPFVDSFMTR